MPEDSMTREQLPKNVAQNGSETHQDTFPSTTQPTDPGDLVQQRKHLGWFADIRSFVSPAERERKRSERNQRSEELLSTDLERIAVLETIQTSIATSSITNNLQIQKFPDTEDLLDRYYNLPPEKTGKFQDEVNKQTETGIKQTLDILLTDIRTLYLDAGENSDEITGHLQKLTDPEIKGERKHFGTLGKNERMGILNHALELRNGLLRNNMGYYLNLLSAVEEFSMQDESDIPDLTEK